MRLETDQITIENVKLEQLRTQLDQLDPDTNARAILSSDEENYVQTAVFANGFVVEKRQGSAAAHFHAVPAPGTVLHAPPVAAPAGFWKRLFGLAPLAPVTSAYAMRFADMERIFIAYLTSQEAEVPVTWEQGFSTR